MAIAEASKVFSDQIQFDPTRCERDFRVVVSDYGATIGVPELSRSLNAIAPAATLRTVHISTNFVTGVPEVMRDVDAMVLPHGVVAGLPHRDLYEDRWVCVVATTNTIVGADLTLEDLARLPWVYTFDGAASSMPLLGQLRASNVELRPQAVAQTFLSTVAMVASTERAALLQERLARRLASQWGLRALDLPIEQAPIVQALWWQPVVCRPPDHRWFRTLPVEIPD